MVKNPPASVEDAGSIPGLGRFPGKWNGNPLQYSCLGNPMNRGSWWATVHGVSESQTQLSIGPQFSSVQFIRLVMPDSLRPHESQHAGPPCPSPTPGVHSDSSPSSQWCHPAISSSVVPFSSYPQSLPASQSFPMSQLFAWGGQSTGVSASASFLPKKFQGWSPSEWTGWISLQSKGLSRVFSNTTVQKINSSVLSFLHSPTFTSIHDYWINHSLDYGPLLAK